MAKQVTQTGGQAGWTLDVFSSSRSWHGVRESSLAGGIAPGAGQERERWRHSPGSSRTRTSICLCFNYSMTSSHLTSLHLRTVHCPYCTTRGSILHSLQPKTKQTYWPEREKILTNPEANCACTLACILSATISNNPPAHSGAKRQVTVFLLPLAVQRGKNAQTRTERFLPTHTNRPHLNWKPARFISPDYEQRHIFWGLRERRWHRALGSLWERLHTLFPYILYYENSKSPEVTCKGLKGGR